MNAVRVILATLGRDLRTAASYRFAFVGAILGSIWGLIAFRFISQLVRTGQFSTSSVSYFRFAVIGVIFASILEPAAVGTSASARGEQVQGTLEYMATQPVRRLYLGLSWTAYGVIESLVIAAMVLLLTIPMGFRVSHVDVPVILAVVILSIMIFAAVGSMTAGLVIVFQQSMILPAAGYAVVATISGTLFPISELPGWLQALAHLSPLTYALEALRSALLPGQPPTSYFHDVAILAGFVVVLVPLAAIALELSFRRAQRKGSLATF